MNDRAKTIPLIIGVVLLGVAAFVYGAVTAPQNQPAPAATPTTSAAPKPPTKQQLQQDLSAELPAITDVLTAAYPKSATDYTMKDQQLYGNGDWFGATLRYTGSDTLNRDTLRVLMQKKNDTWVLRTKPPEILLSAKKYPDVPKSIIDDIDKVVGLP